MPAVLNGSKASSLRAKQISQRQAERLNMQNKIVIVNRDINDPAETKEVFSLEIDISDLQAAADAEVQKFSANIALAALDSNKAMIKEIENSKRRQAQVSMELAIKQATKQIEQETGFSVGYKKPWVYKARSQVEYNLWKRVVPMFVQHERMLDIGPTALAKQLDITEPNFTVTRDMMYDPLSDFAKRDATKLLKTLGITLVLRTPVTIRSIQKQLIERRDMASGQEVEEFNVKVKILGDLAYVHGKPYKIQLGASGRRRIKIGGKDWLSLDTLKAFCPADG